MLLVNGSLIIIKELFKPQQVQSKSRVAHALIVEQLQQPNGVVTVLVPQVSLLKQWADALDDILGFKVGRCGGGKKNNLHENKCHGYQYCFKVTTASILQ